LRKKTKKDEKSIKIEIDSDATPLNLTSATGPTKIGEKRKKDSSGKGKEPVDKRSKKMQEDAKKIQEDPKTSKIYKNLFTTCEAAKNQPKAFWVLGIGYIYIYDPILGIGYWVYIYIYDPILGIVVLGI